MVPVHCDTAALARTLAVTDFRDVELIVAMAPDDEAPLAPLRAAHPSATWLIAPLGRASQMNAAAAVATGDWILFLHADTRLPARWRDAVADADQRAAVAGCFRFALDVDGFAARAIAWGVHVRVAVLHLPYGDQALFVRRDVFRALGGYAALPIMEDVDLVRRLRRHGPMVRSPLEAVSSARRWQRDGWVRRTLLNVGLIALFFMGVAPQALARIDARVRRASTPGARA